MMSVDGSIKRQMENIKNTSVVGGAFENWLVIVSNIIRAEIENYKKSLDIASVGTVVEIGDGIARIYGLQDAMSGELLEFPNGIKGMALNLEENNVGASYIGRLQTNKRRWHS